MFEDIIKKLEETEKLGSQTVHNLKQVDAHLSKIIVESQDKLMFVKGKYNFENRQHIFPIPANDTHLEFWRGSGEYNVAVSLADKTGFYDIDKEFGIIIPEWPYDNFEKNEDETEQERYFKIADNLFYSWMSFIWQTIKGYEIQLAVKIIENNSSSIFSLNDFAWHDLSNFISFNEPVAPRKRFFTRDLALAEIYSRADIKYRFSKFPEHYRIFSKNDNLKEVRLKQGNVLIDNVQIEKNSNPANEYAEIKKRQIMFVNICNELLNNDWIDITFGK
jgi:hypothetical protein